MDCLKKKFFILDIKSQIQYGILFVSSCVCLLVFLLIITYSFVMVNLSYVDVIAVIDLKETEAIHKINDYYLNYQLVNEEMSKISIQWVRNLMKNIEGKANLVNPKEIQNFFVNTNDLMQRSINHNSLYFKNYNHTVTEEQFFQSNSEFLGRLFLAIPMLKIISRFRLIGGRNINIFQNFIIHSFPMNTTFFLTLKNFLNDEFNLNELGYDLFNSYLNNYNYLNENTIIYDYIDQINKEFIGNRNVKEIAEKHPANMILNNRQKVTISFELRKDSQNMLENLIVGTWDSEISDTNNHNILDQFRGIQKIITKDIFLNNANGLATKKEIINSFETCEYFRSLEKFKNRLQDTIFEPLNYNFSLVDCFQSDKTKLELEKLVNLNTWLSYNYKRKLKIPLYYNDKNFKLNSNYKIIKSQYPDEKSLQIIKTDFLIFNRYNLYLFSNSKYSENIYNLIFLKFLAMMMLIILSNLMLWVFILFTIFLLELKLSSKLTNPIKTLIKNLHQINKLDNNNILKEIEQIKYEDDSNINELFKICKEMIRGGFKIKIEKNKSDQFENLDKIYEICEIKLNNLIIREDKIENYYNKNFKNMFNFVPTNILDKNLIENEKSKLESDNELNIIENSIVEEINLAFENSSSKENIQCPYIESDDVNLSFVRDDLISSEQRTAINKILSNPDFEKIELNGRRHFKNMTLRDNDFSHKTHPFLNLENLFDYKLDKEEIQRVSVFTSEKGKENFLFLYYEKLNVNKCINL